MADLYLVRHGQTELNVQNILQGGHDSPLTARGREQALATRAAFEARGVTFDRVYSSPLGRARHTAELIAGEGCSIELVDDLREWHLGSLEGTSNREMPRSPGVIIRWPLVASLKAAPVAHGRGAVPHHGQARTTVCWQSPTALPARSFLSM
ncbi:MAG: histidine phosphatase family protein [Collinsella sp.]